MLDNNDYMASGQLSVLESQLQEITSIKSLRGYRKALSSLSAFLKYFPSSLPLDSPRCLYSWIISMCIKGLSKKTAIQYLSHISALYNTAVEKNSLPPSSCFAIVKARLVKLPPEVWSPGIPDTLLEAFKEKIQRAFYATASSGPDRVLIDFIVFALINPSLSPEEVIGLTINSNIDRFSGIGCEIIRRNILPRHKYIFSFNQSRLTPRQLQSLADEKVIAFCDQNAIPPFGDPSHTLRAYWMAEALKTESDYYTLLKFTGPLPASYPILSLLPQNPETAPQNPEVAPQNEPRLQKISSRIAARLLENSRKWWAIRLKRGKKYDRFRKFAALNGTIPAEVELFNPIDRLTLKKEGKLKIKRVPFLGTIFMVKATRPEVESFIRQNFFYIKPYRPASTPNHGLLEIPETAMKAFQTAIGHFSDEFEIGPIGSLTLRPGDRIVVIGGTFSGYEGEFIKVSSYKKDTVYRIRLFGDANDIEWRLKDTRLIEKL